MIYEIRNKFLTAKINSFGAELISVIDNKTGTEFIWQGDEKYWSDHSPVLFPQCGRIFNGKYLHNGKVYEMGLHGFAWHSEFTILKKNENSAEFLLKNDAISVSNYPFNFEFVVGYKLEDNKLVFSYYVKNVGESVMYYSYGGHPGFNCPINNMGEFENYYLEFSKDEYLQRTFDENGLYPNVDIKWKLVDKRIPLKHSLFDNDAIFFIDDSDTVSLKNTLNNNYIKVTFTNMKNIGFWHAAKTDAPYICFEPQFGFPGVEGYFGEIKDKVDIAKLESNEEHFNSFSVEFHVE